MHLHPIVISAFCQELNLKLRDSVILDIFSLSKQEIIFHFAASDANFFSIKMTLAAQSVFFSFYDNLQPKGNKFIPQFTTFFGARVLSFEPIPFDRGLVLKSNMGIFYFKLHGRNANLIALLQDNSVICFRNEFEVDRVNGLEKLSLLWQQYLQKRANLSVNGPLKQYLKQKNLAFSVNYNLEELDKVYAQLSEGPFYIVENNQKVVFSLFPVSAAVCHKYDKASDALNQFQRLYLSRYAFQSTKNALLKERQLSLNQKQKNITTLSQKLSILQKENYKTKADLIMANLHLKNIEKELTLPDFYSDTLIKVKLDINLSLQANAEKYYRKSKNQQLEVNNLKNNIQKLDEEAMLLINEIAMIDKTEDFKILQKFVKEKLVKVSNAERKPFRTFSIDGYTVLVGKSAKDNDELTLKYAKKEDFWLHAKDCSGSHVVIKTHDHKIPSHTLEKIAGIAAYFSKRKQDSLCPVIVTRKKFVRKNKALAPGEVIVAQEDVILVKPQKPELPEALV